MITVYVCGRYKAGTVVVLHVHRDFPLVVVLLLHMAVLGVLHWAADPSDEHLALGNDVVVRSLLDELLDAQLSRSDQSS